MPKSYKILLSAYACEPSRGSEPGVGWHWALEIAKRGHDVWVITRKNNKTLIDTYFKVIPQPDNLHFIYYDVSRWLSWWKKGEKGVHLYYYLWQIGIIPLAKILHQKISFDLVHHITFVTIHQPSFLFLLKNCKFIYGPAGGGDIVPKSFLKSFPYKKRLRENTIQTFNKLLRVDPLRQWMFKNSDLVFVNSKSTKNYLPKTAQTKTKISLAIGVDFFGKIQKTSSSQKFFELLFVGNFLHWKGLNLVLNSYKKLNSSNIKLTLIGKGNIKELKELKDKIYTLNWLPQKKLMDSYSIYDLLVFPSFRDSGGMVVLEALARGLPVICLDLGGPGQIVNETCGRVISTRGKSEKEVIHSISNTILELEQNPKLLQQLSNGAIQRAKEFTWEKTVARVYEEIEGYMLTSKLDHA